MTESTSPLPGSIQLHPIPSNSLAPGCPRSKETNRSITRLSRLNRQGRYISCPTQSFSWARGRTKNPRLAVSLEPTSYPIAPSPSQTTVPYSTNIIPLHEKHPQPFPTPRCSRVLSLWHPSYVITPTGDFTMACSCGPRPPYGPLRSLARGAMACACSGGCLESACETAHVRRYPLAGFVDAGISIAIDDLLDSLKGSISPEDAHSFLQDISCFVSPPRDQETSEPTSMEEPGSVAQHSVPSRHNVLHLPVLLVTHQIHECGLDDATRNRQRLNCVSAVQFLATLGIKDFPVYGFATSGQYGYVSSTWFSSADNVRRCPMRYHDTSSLLL